MKRIFLFVVFCLFVLLLFLLPSLAFGQDSSSRRTFYLPYFVVGGGMNYADDFRLIDGWEFGVVVQNISDVSASVDYIWWTSEGLSSQALILNTELVARKRLTEATAMGSGLSVNSARQHIFSYPSNEIKTGWMKVTVPETTNGPAAKLYGLLRHKTNGVVDSLTTISPVELAVGFNFYGKSYKDPTQDQYETGLAIANPNLEPAIVTITMTSRTGTFLQSTTEIVPRMGQLVKMIDQIGQPLWFLDYEGQIIIESSVPIAVTAQLISAMSEGKTPDLTEIPVTSFTPANRKQ